MFVMATKQLLIEDGLTSQQVEDWAPKAIAGMEKLSSSSKIALTRATELDNDATYHAWFRWRIAWGRTKSLTSVATTSAHPATQEHGQNQIRPNMVPNKRHMAAQAALKEKVRHFQIPHCHVRNKDQSLAYIEERTKCSFSTRGQF